MPKRPVIVFYGDSIVSGYARAGAPDYRWSTLVSARLGAQERNFSQDGMGFLAQRETTAGRDNSFLDEVRDTSADLIVTCLGVNDIPLMRERDAEVAQAIGLDFSRLKAAHPHTPVLVTMFYPIPELSERSGRLRMYLEQAAAEHGFYFSDALIGPLQGLPSNFSNDGIHPSMRGHAELALAIEDTIARLLDV
ncbi:SGNH/GDSL hydrolase family protein [Boudabousia marimammalium]|uniref:SGNH hydrolase-type esterase domain-containing protein n=1 Tax=Boudabousia marimammalium TaxID=156892 RepID=A0A1Q5PRE6_9ACTO|nr:SGNH/GDSL hydrolase family protein [Boudabousia marimammalium]OKL50178.1 hypothetical protein BM477_01930 [Boudabousia marimammalium]